MFLNELEQLTDNKAIVINNITCPYCSLPLCENPNNTKEHVIGRRFVPKGSLSNCWNLIVRACKNCNSEKSDLENDISAITLAGRMWFDTSNAAENINEAKRKSKSSISRKTRKPVIESQEHLKFKISPASGVEVTFNMTSPPQIEDKRVYELARLQIMAFFYFVTYDKVSRTGGFWQEGFHPLSFAHHKDWGNVLQKSFMNKVADWEPRWIGITADGHFKSIIRRHPTSECWSWAVEWNRNYRVIGFFGSRKAAQELVNEFEFPDMMSISSDHNSHIAYRLDIELSDDEDVLFKWTET